MLNPKLMIARAKSLGFSFIGFTGVDQPPHFSNFNSWLKEKDIGNLQFLGRDYVINGRKDPSSLLENAKSIIILGSVYKPAHNIIIDESQGSIAAYAQYPDYHQVLKENAKKLISNLNADLSTKIKARIFIDSGPMMEKDQFYASGLGWIGKHSIGIHPQYGSFFLICCIVIDRQILLENTRIENLCGNCKICKNACPTGCIENYTIDPTRCISYLTIEHKGIIPLELRNQIGNHIFGCDICQQVCPLNQQIKIPDNGIFFGKQQIIPHSINLAQEISYNEKQFHEKYGKTPVSRLSFIQYKRNIITAIGNSKNSDLFDAIATYLLHSSVILRCHAVWALHEIEMKKSIILLQDLLKKERDPSLIDEIHTALQ